MTIPMPPLEGVADGFEPMPAGIYDAEVSNVEVAVISGDNAKNKGKNMLKWTFDITEEEYSGRKQWVNTMLFGEGLAITKGTLLAIGFTHEEIEDPDWTLDPEEAIGRAAKLVVTVGKNPKTKEDNNSVRRVLPLDWVSDDDTESAELP